MAKQDAAPLSIGAQMVAARWAKSTQQQRSDAARHAVNARWAAVRAAREAAAKTAGGGKKTRAGVKGKRAGK